MKFLHCYRGAEGQSYVFLSSLKFTCIKYHTCHFNYDNFNYKMNTCDIVFKKITKECRLCVKKSWGKINAQFFLEYAWNLTREVLYDNLNKMILLECLVKIVIKTLMCQIWCIFKTKWLALIFISNMRCSEKIK